MFFWNVLPPCLPGILRSPDWNRKPHHVRGMIVIAESWCFGHVPHCRRLAGRPLHDDDFADKAPPAMAKWLTVISNMPRVRAVLGP